MEVYLIRHTTPEIGKGICYGQADIPLAASFQSEANQLIQCLPKVVDVVYSSPSGRCTKLAELIKSNLPVITDKRLLEINFGDWEMKAWNEIDQLMLNSWMKDFVNVLPPSGENLLDLSKRVHGFIADLVQTDDQVVVIIGHAGIIRCIIAYILEIPLKNIFKIPVNYASITKLNLNIDSCYNRIEFLDNTDHIQNEEI
jgi:alpha-ribazole phosphatase